MSSRLLTTTGVLFAFIVIFLSFSANTNQPRPPPMTLLRPPRIIIVGSGLAGLSAAYTALASNHPVTLLDRSPRPGGNSIKASSGINGAPTLYQTTDDTLFLADTIKSAGARYQQDVVRPNDGTRVDREGLARQLTDDSARAIEWLTKDLDIDLKVVTALGGHSVARTHRGSGSTPPGAALITGLLTKLKSHKNFELIPSAEVLKLVTNPSAPGSPVTGVEFVRTGSGGVAWTERLAGPVVFAAGGFAGDSRAGGLLEKYRLDLKGFPATAEARPGATGILEAVGAVPVDMEAVQIHPTGFVAPGDEGAASKFLAAEILRGVGGVMMRGSKRFVNEMGLRSAVSRVIMEGEDRWVRGTRLWDVDLVMDEGAAKAAEGHMQFYLWKGLMSKVPGAELSPEVQASIREYSKIVVGETADSFGRKDFGKWSVKPDDDIAAATFYVGKVTPVVHFTMGGVAFDTEARVLRRAGDGKLEAIPGLWAAGEVTGGLHGDNRLGGSSLLECVVFGRIAGRKAAENLPAAASD